MVQDLHKLILEKDRISIAVVQMVLEILLISCFKLVRLEIIID